MERAATFKSYTVDRDGLHQKATEAGAVGNITKVVQVVQQNSLVMICNKIILS